MAVLLAFLFSGRVLRSPYGVAVSGPASTVRRLIAPASKRGNQPGSRWIHELQTRRAGALSESACVGDGVL